MLNKERIYDEQISPLMAQILAICKEHEMPMFATFQFSDDEFCTSAQEHQGHPIFKHYRALSQCIETQGVNIDKYIFWVAKRNKGMPHSSLVLLKMGVPSSG